MTSRSKRILTVVSLMLSLFILLGCAEDTELLRLSAKKKTNNYGINFSVAAGSYLEQLAAKYGSRTTMLQKKQVRGYIVSELKKAGYSDRQIKIQVADGIGRNIVLTVEGTDRSRQIVVGAHYDGSGDGDNASGVALLLAEAVGLAGRKLPVTVRYVFFDLEEIGSFGARHFVNSMSKKEIASTLFMVNLDSLAFGDYCNVYGGVQDTENKTVRQTEVYRYAMKVAGRLGFNTYGTKYLDGYYAKYGRGPKPDPKGLFTNPWTFGNPAPANPGTFSPSIGNVSDHACFAGKGIPYIYFEASNWFASGGSTGRNSYTGYFETADTTIGQNGMFMNTKYDTLENLEKYFPGRAMEHFNLFSPVLSYLILHPNF